MHIIRTTGYAIDKDVDIVVNSANGYLLHDSSGAGRLRVLSDPLDENDTAEYVRLLGQLPEKVRNLYLRIPIKHSWVPTYCELSAIKLLLRQQGYVFRRGTAVLDKHWSKKMDKAVIHAIAMSYMLTKNTRVRLPATKHSLRSSLKHAFEIAIKQKASSIAFPVMAARPTYGLGPKVSYGIVEELLPMLEGTTVKKAVICFDNDVSAGYLEQLEKGSL